MTQHIKKRPDLSFTPMECFLSLPSDLTNLCFLTSDGSEDSRWSIIAWGPTHTLTYNGQQTILNNEKQLQAFGKVFHNLHQQRKIENTSHLPFIGGGIGVIDFEYGYELLEIPYKHDGRPLIEYLFFDNALVYDHLHHDWYQVGTDLGADIGVDIGAFVRTGHDLSVQRKMSSHGVKLSPSWDKKKYLDHFKTIHNNIRQGEIYQACLTMPFTGQPVSNSRQSFAHLFQHNPSPMAAYLELPSRTILSLSPERFFKWDGNYIHTKPIKGTRERSSIPAQDKKNSQDLLNDPKEQAELNMITDLLRNDLAKISQSGSVQVVQHRALQQLPHIWHTYSHIKAQTKESIQPWDIIEALFPGGSISGCPKRRAVQLLADVEGYRRRSYTGSIGYLSDHGTMDQSIVIRSLEQSPSGLQAAFGGGIVWDSSPELEYQECFSKSLSFSCDTILHQTDPSAQRTNNG